MTPFLLFVNPAMGQASKSQKHIRAVKVFRDNVFPPTDRDSAILPRLANRLHIVTRESVIRAEFLFKAGDLLDEELLAESERKLRQLDFLGEVRIETEAAGPDSVDVLVHTQDQWSTIFSGIFDSGGGRTELGGALEDFNFLGFGKTLFGEAVHESDVGITWSLGYDDPQLFESRWKASTSFSAGPLLKSAFLMIDRPFYSPDVKWAYGLAGLAADETQRLYDNGNEISRLKHRSQGVYTSASRAFGERFRKRRIDLAYRYENRDFRPLGSLTTTPLPDDELIHATALSFSVESISHAEETRIDKFVQTEDFVLGRTTEFSIARAGFPIPVGEKRFEFEVSHDHGFQIVRQHYLFVTASFETQMKKNTILSLQSRYYNRMISWQTLAVNLELDVAKDLEESSQFLLGGDSGLRGYRAREFSGDKRFVMNIESRMFSPFTVLTVALGGVVFFDAGQVWKRSQNMNLAQLQYSLGFGLRLGYTKAPGASVGRVDFGWPLNRGGGFGLSLGIDQHF